MKSDRLVSRWIMNAADRSGGFFYRRRAAMNPAPAAMTSALLVMAAPVLATGLVGMVTFEPPVAEATAEVPDPERASAQI